MKINEIKNLKQFDVIAITDYDEQDTPNYNIYYVIFNFPKRNEIEICQGYYEYNNNRHIFLEETRQYIDYDEALLHYDLIHKAGE